MEQVGKSQIAERMTKVELEHMAEAEAIVSQDSQEQPGNDGKVIQLEPLVRRPSQTMDTKRRKTGAAKRKHEVREHTGGLYDDIDKLVRHKKPLSLEEVQQVIGHSPKSLLNTIRYLDWLVVERTKEGYSFWIDEDLKAICTGLSRRPSLRDAEGNAFSIPQFLSFLRHEIQRRRKEYFIERSKARWDHAASRVKLVVDLLDWTEDQLSRAAQAFNQDGN